MRSQQSAFNELRSSKAAVALSSISSIEQQARFFVFVFVFVFEQQARIFVSVFAKAILIFQSDYAAPLIIISQTAGCTHSRVGRRGVRVASKREPVVQPVDHNQGGELSLPHNHHLHKPHHLHHPHHQPVEHNQGGALPHDHHHQLVERRQGRELSLPHDHHLHHTHLQPVEQQAQKLVQVDALEILCNIL